MKLDESQQKAVDGLVDPTNKICLLTGGPGTGKSTTLRHVLDNIQGRVVLCAPTGKAAKRAAEVTDTPATTIHRLIKWGGEERSTVEKINADVVIVDESSMIDTILLSKLIKAMPEYARLILVGDAMQLPPVGAGQPFHDLLDVVPTFRLTKTHRQAGDSWVIDNARRIIDGEIPNMDDTHDFTFIETHDIEGVVREMFIADPSITVLSPQNERGAGVRPLNTLIQGAVNPAPALSFGSTHEAFGGDYTFRVGDRVIQKKNDAQRLIVNGDIGTITEIRSKKDIVVEFDCGPVRCVGDHLGDLRLAYALTVHASQGSEWKHVVLVADSAHGFMLRRQLVYTAVTRTSSKLTIVGSKGAIAKACATPLETNRRTALRERLSA